MNTEIVIRISQFIKFSKLLKISNYTPWFFPVQKNGKNPDAIAISKRKYKNYSTRFSWKEDHARLTTQECIEYIKQGYNIGIAARQNDQLIIIDIDNPKYTQYLPKETLISKSRSRIGLHGFYIQGDDKVKINIPTDYGEMRCVDQYVLAPGSYVDITEKDLQKKVDDKEIDEKTKNIILKDKLRGYYTVEQNITPRTIIWEEIPIIFKEQQEKNIKTNNEIKLKNNNPIKLNDNHSAIFDLKISDIIHIQPNRREPHPLHESDTGQNFSISKDGNICHCWRHCVSLNAIQFLVVKNGYMKCQDAGTPHKDKRLSKIKGDNGAIFYAWLQAKKDGLIPIDDPVPIKSMIYIAKKHLKYDACGDFLPTKIYNNVIKIIRDEY